MGRYTETFDRSLADPEGFWGEAAKASGAEFPQPAPTAAAGRGL